MAKSAKTSYECSECGASSIKWTGRCSQCGEFGTVTEVVPLTASAPGAPTTSTTPTRAARAVGEVGNTAVKRLATGVGEFDRVLSGGFVPGQVCLLSGAPGSGKSTLILSVANRLAQETGRTVLYISGEESVEQIAIRARRVGADSPNLLLADDTDLATVVGHIDEHSKAALVIIDSIQTISSAQIDSRAGGVAQVMGVAQALTRIAKSRHIPIVIIGQVTKDSNVAGPRALEHIVDATLTLDGDRHTSLRLLRAVKNRFGALEVAAFEQTHTGMREVVDPSALFRGMRDVAVAGTCVGVTIEGQRAITAEVQSLVGNAQAANPRRAVSGLDSARAAMLVAVVERSLKFRLSDREVYAATIGGMRLTDPGTDLAVCLSIASSAANTPIPLDVVAIGEVTLSGDVRPVSMMTERVNEAIRLGYQRIVVPEGTTIRMSGTPSKKHGARLVEVSNLGQAQHALLEQTPAAAISLP